MRLGPLRWVVLFFTRPVRLSDVAALSRLFKPRAKSSAEAGAVLGERARGPLRQSPERSAPRHGFPTLDQSSQGVDVSEQPLDTLPADLQVALLVPAANPRAPDPSSSGGARESIDR